jgi:hypothetical protein
VACQGRPISPDDEVRVVDDHDQPVAEGEVGHLLTRGPYTIRGYHNDAVANARSFTDDGFYRTGDRVQQLPGGYLVVQGRAGDHINRAGEKISAEEIEDHLLAHPGVFDAAVVSIPDEYLGERSCAFVIPQGEPFKAPALKSWMRGRGLAAFKVPDQIVFVDSFDTTAVGKISRRELRAQLRASSATDRRNALMALPRITDSLADRRRTAAGTRPVAPAARSCRLAGARHAALLPGRIRRRQCTAAAGRGQHRTPAGALPRARYSGVLHRPAWRPGSP